MITWTGGPQPHDQPLDVPVEMTFPDTPGATLLFPLVQTCEQGETRWVDPPNPDGSEPEDPAPLVELTASAGGGASTTASPATTGARRDDRRSLDYSGSGYDRSGTDLDRSRDHGRHERRQLRQHRRSDRRHRDRRRRGRRRRRVPSRPVEAALIAQISFKGSARWPSFSGFTTMRIA